MKALNRKAVRDVWHLRGQVLAICLVIGCGVATFVMSVSTLHSLERTLDTYYERYRFAEVFTHLKRAPAAVASRIAEIPGVAQVQTRIAEAVSLDMPGLAEPAVGRLLSLPPGNTPVLNDLYLRRGGMPRSRTRHEVLVSEAFADAHELVPGDVIPAVMNGRMEELSVAGVVLSPEYIYQIREGDILPDDRHFGVLWMDEEELAAAFDMDGAFNDVALTLMPGASEDEVIARLDRLTEPYGGLGAYGREDHVSHEFVANEIEELRGTAKIVPIIFLAVAAFLLNIVMARLISTQREQIASIKAVGYSKLEIGLHYLRIVLLIVLVGVVLGTVAGAWMGKGLTRMYTLFFHFPVFGYHLLPSHVLTALGVSLIAGVTGTLGAVRRAVTLPPAEAMQPAPPATFRPTVIERSGLQRLLSPAARMILRQIERRPGKVLMSLVGMALATAILVVGDYMKDAIDFGVEYEFSSVQRHDVTVTFTEPTSPRGMSSVTDLPGVQLAEPFRAIAARLRAGHRSRRVGIMGLEPGGTLYRPQDLDGRTVTLPEEGLVLSEKLGELLGVGVGDEVVVEVLQESRPVRRLPVTDLVSDFAGISVYMSFAAANRLVRQEATMSGVFIDADEGVVDELYTALKETPRVAGVAVKEAAVRSFYETIAQSLLVMRTFNVIFAVIIAFGVVYNSARISLSERSRELATLRVVGFTRGEISLIQLGELGLLVVVAVPAGLLLGYGLAAMTSMAYDTELFRIPFVVERSTFGFAAVVVVLAALISGLIVRRMIDHLDLVAVLKTRD